VNPPAGQPLSAEGRKAAAAELLAMYRRDAFAAKAAHDRAVRVGASIVPELAAAALDTGVPSHGQMWLATTIAELGGPGAVDVLVKLLDDQDGGVRAVVAYYGPGLKDEKLTAAIVARARDGKDAALGAWAARGLGRANAAVPDDLVRAALASDEPRARAEIAAVVAARGDAQSAAALVRLLGDAEELVRVAAARAIAGSKVRSAEVMGALVAALDRPGDNAREAACAALEVVSGRAGPYDPKAADGAKRAVVEGWKGWWARRRKS